MCTGFVGETPNISFSFWLSHLNKGFHLERVLFQGHGDSLADTWRWMDETE